MKKIALTALFAISTLSSTAFAAERALLCEYKKHGRGGWVGDAALFIFDEEKGTAQAYDGVIDFVHGKPIKVKMHRASTQRLQFKWRVNKIPTNFTSGETRKVDVNFSATINTKTMAGTIKAIPTVDVLNNTKATGKCRPAKK